MTIQDLCSHKFWETHELECTTDRSSDFTMGKRYSVQNFVKVDEQVRLTFLCDQLFCYDVLVRNIEGFDGDDDMSFFRIVPKSQREILAPPKSFHNFVVEVAREMNKPAYSNVLGTNVLLSVVAEEAAKRFEEYVRSSVK